MIRFLGAVPVPIPLVESRGFSFDLNVFRDKLSAKTRLIILNSPANPAGSVIPKEDLVAIAELIRDKDVMVMSDEIYSRIWYDAEPSSISSLDGMVEKTIILDGFSKTYSMTGWRLGFGVMPTWLAEAVNILTVNSNSCTASFTQRAGMAALSGPQDCVTAMVAEFSKRRVAIVNGLNEIPGFRCVMPAGAFYAFPNVTGTGIPSKDLSDILLNDAGVACLNGTGFGKHGEGYIRFSYANSLDNILEAVRRIRELSSRWAKD
jgi:aspartate/methionine/tyrosine aminotransferase